MIKVLMMRYFTFDNLINKFNYIYRQIVNEKHILLLIEKRLCYIRILLNWFIYIEMNISEGMVVLCRKIKCQILHLMR